MPAINKLPTLGYLHKVVCDSLGLWSSDNEDVTFQVAATEKERRTALRHAFEAIKKENGTCGSHNDLVAATAQLAPADSQKVKKSRTIQTYVNDISKSDFESIDEYVELRQYIEVLLNERYARWGIAELAVRFYVSAIDHYREFVREYACNAQSQINSYQYFLNEHIRLLPATVIRELLPSDTWPASGQECQWPLKAFADAASRIAGISLHKLHQYHEFEQEGLVGEQIWSRDFTSQPVNTRSKQVIDRLRKHSRMKWETFYPTLQPLTYHLPKAISAKAFAMHAFSAMIAHNLNTHVADCGPSGNLEKHCRTQQPVEKSPTMPSSDLLDLLHNGYPARDESVAKMASKCYQSLLDEIRSLPGSLSHATDIPNSLELIYGKDHDGLNEATWLTPFENSPNWLEEWCQARQAWRAGKAQLALSHFSSALVNAKYAAGPLFIPFYIELCAFCKSQYRLLSLQKKEDLFERLYDGLGSNATRYAGLVGYAPKWERDSKSLMPHTTLPLKSKLILSEIDALTRQFST